MRDGVGFEEWEEEVCGEPAGAEEEDADWCGLERGRLGWGLGMLGHAVVVTEAWSVELR